MIDDMSRPFLVKERNVIMLPYEDKYTQVLPKNCRVATVKGRMFYMIKNGPRINAILWRMKEPVPSPIYYDDYDWSDVEIFAAQAQMAGLLVARSRCYNLSDVGTGKTLGALLAIDWLFRKKYATKVLVLAPLSTLDSVWNQEIKKHMSRLRPIILHGTKTQRLKALKEKWWNVGIINHDGIAVIHDELKAQKFDVFIVDELASFRDTRTRRWKLLKSLVEHAPFAAGLTGSPTPNAPSDAYGLLRLLTPENARCSFRTFRQMVEVEVGPNRWLPKTNAKETVYSLLQPAVRFKREDIVELKEVTLIERQVTLSAKQQAALKELKQHACATYPEGLVEGVNAAVLINKLLQICAGAVYTTDRSVVDLEPTQRLETAKDIIDGADGKVLLFVPYKHVAAQLTAHFKSYNPAVITGEVSTAARTEVFAEFQDPNSPLRLIIAVPSCLAHGVTLTEANHIIWWSPLHSREIYQQANGRITRIGQKRKQLLFHLCGDPVERAVYNNLEAKGNMQDAILAMFERAA
jgi:SNF2 family DNA or RNA helicase